MGYVDPSPIQTEEKAENYFKKNSLQLTFQVVGIIVVLLNLWLATKLAPLAEGIRVLNVKVDSVEAKTTTTESKISSVDVLNAQMTDVQLNLNDIKSAILRLENKTDRIILK